MGATGAESAIFFPRGPCRNRAKFAARLTRSTPVDHVGRHGHSLKIDRAVIVKRALLWGRERGGVARKEFERKPRTF